MTVVVRDADRVAVDRFVTGGVEAPRCAPRERVHGVIPSLTHDRVGRGGLRVLQHPDAIGMAAERELLPVARQSPGGEIPGRFQQCRERMAAVHGKNRAVGARGETFHLSGVQHDEDARCFRVAVGAHDAGGDVWLGR
jgi:hypothetical protein